MGCFKLLNLWYFFHSSNKKKLMQQQFNVPDKLPQLRTCNSVAYDDASFNNHGSLSNNTEAY